MPSCFFAHLPVLIAKKYPVFNVLKYCLLTSKILLNSRPFASVITLNFTPIRSSTGKP